MTYRTSATWSTGLGTTFSNIEEKGEYDSKSKAVYTFEEIDHRFVDYVTCTYRKSYHEGIHTTPANKYNEGLEGNDKTLGRGYPDIPSNSTNLLVSFLPCTQRTVQRDGVTWDHLKYQSTELKQFLYKNRIGGENKKYLIKRDPRDIRVIYFYPDRDTSGKYIVLPLADSTPVDSIFLEDWNFYVKERKRRGMKAVNTKLLLEAYVRQQLIEAEATRRTREVRRDSKKYLPEQPPSRPEEIEFNPSVESIDWQKVIPLVEETDD